MKRTTKQTVWNKRNRHWVCRGCLAHFTKRPARCPCCEGKALWLLDSDVEYDRYKQLRWLEKVGDISRLTPKEKFPLVVTDQNRHPIEIYNKKGAIKKDVPVYICDFSYEKDGNLVVEDVKTQRWQADDPKYKTKAALFKLIYGFEITILRR